MRLLVTFIASLCTLVCGVSPSSMRGGTNNNSGGSAADNKSGGPAPVYRYVYWGNFVNDSGMVGFPQLKPNTLTWMETPEEGYTKVYALYQLPEDGTLPEVLTTPGSRNDFSAIVRYNPKSGTDIERICNWITANRHYHALKEIHVVNYPIPGETPEDRLDALSESFPNGDPKVRAISSRFDADGKGKSPFEFLVDFSSSRPPHEVISSW